MFKIVIQEQGFKAIQARYRRGSKQLQPIADQGLRDIANYMAGSVREEIHGNTDPFGFTWHGTLFQSVDIRNVGKNEVDVLQDPEGLFAMYGTPRKPESTHPPKGLVSWAESKLGLDPRDAYPVALAIQRRGTLSSARFRYPAGARGYGWPEYVVERKEKAYLRKAAEEMADLMVAYLSTDINRPFYRKTLYEW